MGSTGLEPVTKRARESHEISGNTRFLLKTRLFFAAQNDNVLSRFDSPLSQKYDTKYDTNFQKKSLRILKYIIQIRGYLGLVVIRHALDVILIY